MRQSATLLRLTLMALACGSWLSPAHADDESIRSILPLGQDNRTSAWIGLSSRTLDEHHEQSLDMGLDIRIGRRLSLFVGAHACRWREAAGRTLNHEDARAGLRIWLFDSP